MKKLSKVWYSIVGVQYRLSYRLDGRSTNVYAAKSKKTPEHGQPPRGWC